MLTIEDCIALSGLTEAEIDALAEHEHIPEIVALELGNYLIRRPDGVPAIRAIIRDDIAAAERRGDLEHAHTLRLVLRHFLRCHRPQALAAAAPLA
jgi:hypothetical protein